MNNVKNKEIHYNIVSSFLLSWTIQTPSSKELIKLTYNHISEYYVAVKKCKVGLHYVMPLGKRTSEG